MLANYIMTSKQAKSKQAYQPVPNSRNQPLMGAVAAANTKNGNLTSSSLNHRSFQSMYISGQPPKKTPGSSQIVDEVV